MKKYVYALFIFSICLQACKKSGEPDDYDAPCDADNSVMDRIEWVNGVTTQFNYDGQNTVQSYATTGNNPATCTYTEYSDGYQRTIETPGDKTSVRIYFDGADRVVHTSTYKNNETVPETEYALSYDGQGRILLSQRLDRAKSQGVYERILTDSVRYTWNNDDVVRSDKYVSYDTVHYSFYSYQIYDYDPVHSGKQNFNWFCAGENPYLHRNVNWKFNAHSMAKITTYDPMGAVSNSTVYQLKFDSHDRFVSGYTNMYTGSTSSSVFQRIVYKCK